MFLGIDLGTSEIKVLLMDEAGRVTSTTRAALPISRPNAGWSEQSPEDWWMKTQDAIDQLRRTHAAELAAVKAIGLSGQMHGAVLLDRSDRPLRPAILWNDSRSDEQCAELMRRAPSLPAITGNLAMPGFTAPKLLWVAQHEPEIFANITTVLLPKDYVRLQLTGEKASDVSDASGTLWLDVAQRQWSQELIEGTHLNIGQMPMLSEGHAVTGQLRADLARRWGMGPSVAVAGGAGDNAASAVGIGAVSAGEGFLSLGTSGVIFVVDDAFRPSPESGVHAFCHTLPDRWCRMSVMLSAASCLSWATRLVGARDEAAFIDEIAAAPETALEKAPLFLPYLSGERTPHNDPHARGLFFGLTHDTDRALLGYSVLEGVALGLGDGWLALGTPAAGALSVVGGGARSMAWMQLIADTLDIGLQTHTTGDVGAALGAARLAQLACGASEEQACVEPQTTATYEPRKARQPFLLERQERFRALYARVAGAPCVEKYRRNEE